MSAAFGQSAAFGRHDKVQAGLPVLVAVLGDEGKELTYARPFA
jgi:hypothetical protein